MRFMMIVKANKDSEAGVLPTEEMLAAMAKYNEELVKAGILLSAEGLQASAKGSRVRFTGDKRTVIDGPFTETKELVASYALLEVPTMAEAIRWTKRFLEVLGEGECEIRPLFDPADFGPPPQSPAA